MLEEAVEGGLAFGRDVRAEPVAAGTGPGDAEHPRAGQVGLEDGAVERDEEIAAGRQQVQFVVVGLFLLVAQPFDGHAGIELLPGRDGGVTGQRRRGHLYVVVVHLTSRLRLSEMPAGKKRLARPGAGCRVTVAEAP
jgi:hypothetical protein